jgi:hypothetical protein
MRIMYPKFTLLQLRVIVLSILLLIGICLVPAMQTGIYGQLLQQQQSPVISTRSYHLVLANKFQLANLQYQEYLQVMQLLIVQFILIGMAKIHFRLQKH